VSTPKLPRTSRSPARSTPPFFSHRHLDASPPTSSPPPATTPPAQHGRRSTSSKPGTPGGGCSRREPPKRGRFGPCSDNPSFDRAPGFQRDHRGFFGRVFVAILIGPGCAELWRLPFLSPVLYKPDVVRNRPLSDPPQHRVARVRFPKIAPPRLPVGERSEFVSPRRLNCRTTGELRSRGPRQIDRISASSNRRPGAAGITRQRSAAPRLPRNRRHQHQSRPRVGPEVRSG